MSSIECVNCGANLDPDTTGFCNGCGVPVAATFQEKDQSSSDEQSDGREQIDTTPTTTMSSSATQQTPRDGDDAATQDEMSCPQCGSAYEPEQNFCRSCGAELDTDEASTPIEEPASASESGGLEVSISLGDTAVPLTDGESVGAELRPLIVEQTSREKALCISREQFEIVIDPEAEQCWIRDAGSKHGTVLNGEDIPTDEYQEVTDGDTIVLPPDFEATFRVGIAGWADPEHPPTTDSASESESGTVQLYGYPEQVVYDISDGESIGRGDQADVTIDGPSTVSRTHATVEYTTDGWVLIDQSSNGSFIRESESQEWTTVDDRTQFEDGDQLAFGTREDLMAFTVSLD
ncbi:FHA domain-containing protein [Halorubrum ezzemoulense]|nr:FHA domain-containing protein [Halorubrum ezzemoulense]